ncbi:RNA polymerase sigma factor [Akkermansiaceae bacterium]|nr:RNA polymerase sigma factor [bacterium]MDA7930402.1 RNA polymerase sigma factor [Akkermansiaceae bacterium]
MDQSPTVSPELLTRVRAGDEEAWRRLIDLLNPLISKIIRNQVRRTTDHDDLAQEAFTKIFLKLDQFAGKQPFTHWVSRLTINTCYDWLRRQKVRPLVTYSDLGETQAEILEKNLAGQPGEDKESLAAMRELLDRLISTLNPRQQIVIRLLDLEEKSVQDVCDLTGWGESKVKVTAMRARRKLSEQLKKLEPDQ